ncbi:hypothetical protein [Kitasatospora sp. NPDC088351]|uniref:hypothetical protein n=1 Tax=Kitasatospora sp. NPDC088351 TaxID=3155180 RepID=UPI0034462F0E
MSNTMFRRNYPGIAREIGLRRSEPARPAPGARSELDRLTARDARLRRRNQQLNDQLKLAAAQIQLLALRATALEQALEAQMKVTHLSDRRRPG